jgi:hypothetical protein
MGIKIYEDGIPGQYFVAINPPPDVNFTDENSEAFENYCSALIQKYGGEILYGYSPSLLLFAARIDEARALELAKDPEVASVEQDRPIVDPEEFQAPRSSEDGLDPFLAAGAIPWGLDRIDQLKLPLSKSYVPPNDGGSVTVYVIDSGVSNPSNIFSNRLLPGKSFFPKGQTSTLDCSNHGTGVAAVIGAPGIGVAPGVSIVPVRVWCLTGGGATSVAAGVDWVRRVASAPAVANISIAVGKSDCLDHCVERLIASGITCVVAAGNSSAKAAGFSPAGVPDAITVAASTMQDRRWERSNHGSRVDLFAPGHRIDTISMNGFPIRDPGTSLAAGFVSGVVAMFLKRHPNASPPDVAQALLGGSSKGVIKDTNGAPDWLLQVV